MPRAQRLRDNSLHLHQKEKEGAGERHIQRHEKSQADDGKDKAELQAAHGAPRLGREKVGQFVFIRVDTQPWHGGVERSQTVNQRDAAGDAEAKP